MSETLPGTASFTTEADLGTGDAGVWQLWMGRDRIAAKAEGEWPKRAQKVIDRYRDDRKNATDTASAQVHRFNILWSNVQTLLPVLYARTPKPVVQRRFLDKDPIGRLASQVLERAISYSLEQHDFDSVMQASVLDRLLPGRGICRVLYIPTYGDPLDPEDDEADEIAASVGDETPSSALPKPPESPLREVLGEQVTCKYVFWKDYREGPARMWDEVPWIRFRVYMTRDELKARFGASKAMKVTLDFTPPGSTDPKGDQSKPPPDIFKQAEVYEFWCKLTRRVVWVAPGTPDLVLDEVDDPLGLPDFFPTPDPLLATTTNDKRVPVPDYCEYQDQADELDVLTARIDKLTRALKVAGVYAASEKASLQQLFDDNVENRLIPVEDWSQFAQNKGGLEGAILWLPIKQVAETLIQLCDMRDRSKQIIYEITGIGDIIRGSTQPLETATAQKLKASFSTRRQVPQQKRVAKFARDVIRLEAGIIAEHFGKETLSAITGYPELEPVPDLPPAPPQFMPQPGGMMGPMGPPQGGNVVPFGQPGQPQQPPQPQPQPNPAFAEWQKVAQARAQIMGKNAAAQTQFDQAIELIRRDGMTGFRLDIESDSTIALDEIQDRADRSEFLQALLPLLEQMGPVVQGNPAMAELGKQLVMFGVRGFPIARGLEEAIDKGFDAMAGMPPPQPKGSGKAAPDPQLEQVKIAAQVHDTQAQTQTDQQAAVMKAQTDQQAIQQKREAANLGFQEAQLRASAQQENDQAEAAIKGAEIAQREWLESAKISAMGARSAKGLD